MGIYYPFTRSDTREKGPNFNPVAVLVCLTQQTSARKVCSELSELKVLTGDTVIAKDVDSKRQLTVPLKSFIYAPERARV